MHRTSFFLSGVFGYAIVKLLHGARVANRERKEAQTAIANEEPREGCGQVSSNSDLQSVFTVVLVAVFLSAAAVVWSVEADAQGAPTDSGQRGISAGMTGSYHPAPPVEPGSKVAGGGELIAKDEASGEFGAMRIYISNCKGVIDNPHYGRGRKYGEGRYKKSIVGKGVVNCPDQKPKAQSWTYLYRYRWYGQEQLASDYDGTQDRYHNSFARAQYKCRRSTSDFATRYTYRNWAYGQVRGWNGKVYRGGQERKSRGVCRRGGLNFL